LRAESSNELLLVHDRHAKRWILFATLWSAQASHPPAYPAAPAVYSGSDEEREIADGTPYVLPALIFFWFASFAWGLWYIAHAV
jgi:hypothetical protein